MKNDLKEQLKQAKNQLPTRAENADVQAKLPQETESFSQMVGSVVPLKSSNRYSPPKEKSLIKPRKKIETLEVPAFYIGESQREAPSQHYKNGRGKQDILKLLAHHYPIIATLDLHGHRQEGLQELLSEFCFYVQNKGVCARIVHGSGLGSQQSRPVLKNIVRTWLIQYPEVLAYTEEASNDGAVLVLFKKNRE